MKRQATAVVAAGLVVLGQTEPLLAARARRRLGAARVGLRRLARGRARRLVAEPQRDASGARSVSQTSERLQRQQAGADAGRRLEGRQQGRQRQRAARNELDRDEQVGPVRLRATAPRRARAATPPSTAAPARAPAARPRARARWPERLGQPVVAGSVNTKYNGSYNGRRRAQPVRRLEHRHGRRPTAAR